MWVQDRTKTDNRYTETFWCNRSILKKFIYKQTLDINTVKKATKELKSYFSSNLIKIQIPMYLIILRANSIWNGQSNWMSALQKKHLEINDLRSTLQFKVLHFHWKGNLKKICPGVDPTKVNFFFIFWFLLLSFLTM